MQFRGDSRLILKKIRKSVIMQFMLLFAFSAVSSCTTRDSDCPCLLLAFLMNQNPSSEIPLGSAFNPYYAFDYTDENLKSIYKKTYINEVRWITDEWAMKMEEIWKGENTLDFTYGDKTAGFAHSNGLKVRGHTLVWESNVPTWIKLGNYTDEEIKNLYKNYIFKTVTHFRNKFPGTVFLWDVVNEPLEEDGSLRNQFFQTRFGGGYEYIKTALTEAHNADPQALLFINEYGAEYAGVKADGLFALAQSLLNEGVPLHGIGFQCHVSIDEDFDPQKLGQQLDRFISLGLKVQITELDVRINDDLTGKNEEKLRRQAELFNKTAKECSRRYPACSGVILWGLTDHENYMKNLPWLNQDEDWPFILDEQFNRKPAYYGLRSAL